MAPILYIQGDDFIDAEGNIKHIVQPMPESKQTELLSEVPASQSFKVQGQNGDPMALSVSELKRRIKEWHDKNG